MAFKSAIELNLYPIELIIKIGDTISDIEEGLNACMWSVGVVLSSNELGLTEEEVDNMPKTELEKKCKNVRDRMLKAGAHYFIQTLAELGELLTTVNDQSKQGWRP